MLAGQRVLFVWRRSCSPSCNATANRKLHAYGRADLLVIGEMGYLAYDARTGDLLYDVVSRRSETYSLMLTTNTPSSTGT